MDVVNNRRATFKKNIKRNEWQLFRTVRFFFFLVSMPPISQQNFSTQIMNMSL